MSTSSEDNDMPQPAQSGNYIYIFCCLVWHVENGTAGTLFVVFIPSPALLVQPGAGAQVRQSPAIRAAEATKIWQLGSMSLNQSLDPLGTSDSPEEAEPEEAAHELASNGYPDSREAGQQ